MRRINAYSNCPLELTFQIFHFKFNLNAKLNECEKGANGAKIKETMCPITWMIQCFGIIYAFNSTQVKCDVGLNVESLIEHSTCSVEDPTRQIE